MIDLVVGLLGLLVFLVRRADGYLVCDANPFGRVDGTDAALSKRVLIDPIRGGHVAAQRCQRVIVCLTPSAQPVVLGLLPCGCCLSFRSCQIEACFATRVVELVGGFQQRDGVFGDGLARMGDAIESGGFLAEDLALASLTSSYRLVERDVCALDDFFVGGHVFRLEGILQTSGRTWRTPASNSVQVHDVRGVT